MLKNIPVAFRVPAALLAIGVCVLGCSSEVGGGSGSGGGGGSGGGSGGGAPDQPCSVLDVTGTIPGVSISITSTSCVYSVGEAAEFTYEIKTDATVPPIEIAASAGCGNCTKASEDPLSFVSYGIGGTSTGGEQQNYCRCDVGCCPPEEAGTITVLATTASDKIQWSGRNWSGPSDTGNPEGDFFPPGDYGVSVTFNGRDQGSVTAVLPIKIVP